MAYYLYKKIRDKRRANYESELNTNTTPSIPLGERAPETQNLSTNKTSDVDNEKDTPIEGEPSKDVIDTEATKAEKTARRKYRWRVVGGLFLPMTVWAFNRTIIAAALTFIASDFHQFSQLNWIISATELTATAFVPAWGQLADIFGRYATLQASVLFMILGSALCAGAPVTNFPMLLAGRGIQGLGTAGIMVSVRIVLSDKVSLKDNAKNNTIFSAVVGVGFGVGPIIGGYLTSVSWRWCFIINIPICVLGMVITHFVTRPIMLGPQDLLGKDGTTTLSHTSSFISRVRTIDFGGQFLFLFGMGLFVLALTWAGAYYPWNDVKVLAPLVVGSVLLVGFFVWEYQFLPGRVFARKYPHQKPMIPLDLLWTRNCGLLMYINFITGMAMYAAFYFVELYFTIVKQFGSDKAGINLLYYLPGLGVGIYLAMFICNVYPRRTWYPLSSGTLIEALGITILAAALHWSHLPTIYALLAVAGLGSGIRYMPNTLHVVGYFRQNIATVVSLMSLSISFGSTLASTIMLNIFNNHMSAAGIDLNQGSDSASSFSSIRMLPPEVQEYVRVHAKESIVLAFYGISSFMWLGVVAVLFLGNVNIKKSGKDRNASGESQAERDNVTKGAYVTSWLRRRGDDGGENV